MNRKSIIIIIIVLLLLLATLIITTSISNKKKGKITKDIEGLEYTDDIVNTNEVFELQNPSLAFTVYNIIKELQYNANSPEVMMAILDQDYIQHYGLDESNVKEHVKEYIGKALMINKITYAEHFQNTFYVFFVECDNNEFIIKYSATSNKYKIYLDDYVKEYGKDNYIKNDLLNVLNTARVQGNMYNYCEEVIYEDDFIISYYEMLSEKTFEDIYNNILTEETKAKYSKDELEKIYASEDSFFNNSNVYSLDCLPSENGYKIYTFTDVALNSYTLTENGYFNFTLEIK